MPAEITGSIILIQDGAQSSSSFVSIPSDAELCLFMASYWISGGGLLTSLTLDGNAFISVVGVNSSSDENAVIWRYIVPSGLRGTSKILAWTWADYVLEGANIFVVFLKNVDLTGDPIRDSDKVSSSGIGTSTTPLIESDPNDLMLCVVGSYIDDADAGLGGQTEVADSGLFRDSRGAIGTKPGVSGGAAMSGSGNYRVVCAVSVKGIGGGVTVSPSAAQMRIDSVNPIVILGSINLTPAFVDGTLTTINPGVILGSLSLTPAGIVFRGGSSGPNVIMPGQVPPLGDGDTNGFIVFLLASSIYQNLESVGIDTGLTVPDENNANDWKQYLFG